MTITEGVLSIVLKEEEKEEEGAIWKKKKKELYGKTQKGTKKDFKDVVSVLKSILCLVFVQFKEITARHKKTYSSYDGCFSFFWER